MAKYGLTLSKAVETIGAIKVPSEIANSIEVIEALRMGVDALNKQIDIGQMLQDFMDDFKEEDTFSAMLVKDIIEDGYMLSEVNNIDD